jgi:cell division protein FtsL
MKFVRRTLAVCLSVLIVAPTASAQSHVISKNTLDKAVQERVARDQSDREAILTLLQRPEVREVAAKAGVSLEKATVAVATLEGQDLREIASHARQVNNELAGGATVVITTTAIIIILLVIILIILAVD